MHTNYYLSYNDYFQISIFIISRADLHFPYLFTLGFTILKLTTDINGNFDKTGVGEVSQAHKVSTKKMF